MPAHGSALLLERPEASRKTVRATSEILIHWSRHCVTFQECTWRFTQKESNTMHDLLPPSGNTEECKKVHLLGLSKVQVPRSSVSPFKVLWINQTQTRPRDTSPIPCHFPQSVPAHTVDRLPHHLPPPRRLKTTRSKSLLSQRALGTRELSSLSP